MKHMLHRSLTIGVALLLCACADLSRLISPPVSDATVPARVAFTAAVNTATSRAAETVTLRVTSSYVQQGGARTIIGVQTITLTSAASQAVPIPVDLATCLADATRDGGNGVAGCPVVLELALVVNTAVVDKQTIGPLRLTPGATSEVSQPISLFDLNAIELTPSASTTLILGSTKNVTAIIRDSRGNEITGRPVTWTSDAPAVATVNTNGLVTAVGLGTAKITASVEAVSASVQMVVTKAPLSLSVAAGTGSGNGVVRSSPAGIDCRVSLGFATGTCSFAFPADAQVTLTSIADQGQSFDAWGQACVGNAVGATCTLTMAQARVVSAQFSALRRVTINARANDGKGRVTGSFGINCRIDGSTATGACTADVVEGSQVTLIAVPDAGGLGTVAQSFAGWGADCSNATGTSCSFTVSGGDRTASAGFAGGKTLSVAIIGAGTGSVASAGAIHCDRANGVTTGVCSEVLASGTSVLLTATPDAASEFIGWSGACAGQSLTCSIDLSESKSVTATFGARRMTITITMGGTGEGAVLVNGAEACARATGQTGTVSCVRTFDMGTVLTLQATSGSQASFAGWSGDCSAPVGNCSLTMTSSRSVTATFSRQPLQLTMSISGTGDGSIVVNGVSVCTRPAGQTVTVTCTRNYEAGTILNVQASAGATAQFTAWDGSCSGSSPSCTFALTQPRAVGATFAKHLVSLTIQSGASGSGTVKSVEGAPTIDCTITAGVVSGPRCSALVPIGGTITLRAVGNTNNALSAWGGICAARSTFECQITVTDDAAASASFVGGVDVELRLSGAGRGTVTFEPVGAPSQMPCAVTIGGVGVNCRFSLPSTSAEGLFRGTPVSGSSFVGFVGPCAESTGSAPVPACTYRGIGFLRVITGTFN